ncbi:uncharacterized protein LOC101242165 [Ciona intestinalis]
MESQDHKERTKRDVCVGICAVISAFLWLGAVTLGILVDANGMCFNNLRFAIFRNKSHVIFDSWMTDITPPKWTHAIWEFIYTWNMLWVAYCVATMCRPVTKRKDKKINKNIEVFPAKFHVTWCACSLTHVGWLLLWDREAFVASLFLQLFVITGSILALITSHKAVYGVGALLQYKRPWDLWVARTLVQNGISVLLTWSIYLLIINVIILMTYQAQLPMHITSTIALAVFGGVVLLWFITEMAVFDRWTRYTFTIYPTVAWIACGIIVRQFYPWSPVTICAITLLCLAVLILVIRVPIVVWRSYSDPLYVEQTIETKMVAVTPPTQCITTIL